MGVSIGEPVLTVQLMCLGVELVFKSIFELL